MINASAKIPAPFANFLSTEPKINPPGFFANDVTFPI
jgi:hypothetical protein